MKNLAMPVWRKDNGEIISCVEKIKVMQQNMEEITQNITDAFEDAILMEIDPSQFKKYLINLIDNLKNPYERY